MQSLHDFARPDVHACRSGKQTFCVQESFREGQDILVNRHLPESTIFIEQVVHPLGRESLGVVSAGRNLEFVFESVDDVFDLGEEGGGDHILNDAVPLLFDRGEVRFEGGFVHGDNMARSNRECTYGLDLVSHAAETWTRVSK